ncbi:MAG: hypothetical protein HUU35_14105, partial [Armatimonadetes bacterium]|nr:hypothetical protein [Armatimonadota bacterium]
MRYTVRSLVFPEVGKVDLTTASQELDPGGDGVVLATRYSCISAGTELAKLSGLQTVPLPHTPGNRAVGRVLAA